MRVRLEPETAFIGKKFAYIFLIIIFGLNLLGIQNLKLYDGSWAQWGKK